MDKAKSQADGPSRRRSMLPQKTRIESVSNPLDSFPKPGSLEAGGQCAALAERQASAVLHAAQNHAATTLPRSKLQPYASTQTPASLRLKSSKPDPPKIGHIPRQPSTSGKSSRDHCANGVYPSQSLRDTSQPHRRISTSSGGSGVQSNAKGSYHGRSLSQQVRPTATSDFPHLKAFPQRQSSMKHVRPAFSAMQQHFSPKKNIQLNSSTLSSQPTSAATSPSADIFHLQMELAQLHLLHRSMLSVQMQWEKSAKGSFEHRFSALYERHIELKEIAHQQQTLINQLSLVHWSQGRSGAQIADKVQLLSHSVSDVCNLLDLEGKYTHILEVFESWFTQALRVRNQRDSNGRENGRDLDFVDGIGDGWKAEAMVLERELTYAARDLDSFGEASNTSNLCRILSTYKKLVVGLLEELDLIQWIENEIMSQESAWIESTIHKLASSVSKSIGTMGPDRKAT